MSILFWSGVAVTLAGLFNATAHFMVIEALRLGRAAVVVPFRYTGILWAMLVGFLVWGETPDVWMLAGAVIVVVSGIYMKRLVAPAP